MVARGWSETEKRAYMLADNKLSLNAGWNEQLLAAELKDLVAADFDIALTGFSPAEFRKLVAESSAGLTDPDDVPDVQPEVVSAPGDVWVLGAHRLICGDATDPLTVDRVLSA